MTANPSSISGTAGGKGHADVRLDSELGVRCDSPLGELLLFGILHISLEMSRQRKKELETEGGNAGAYDLVCHAVFLLS